MPETQEPGEGNIEGSLEWYDKMIAYNRAKLIADKNDSTAILNLGYYTKERKKKYGVEEDQ